MSVASQFDGPKVSRDAAERKAEAEAERNAIPAPLLRAEAGPDAEVVAVPGDSIGVVEGSPVGVE